LRAHRTNYIDLGPRYGVNLGETPGKVALEAVIELAAGELVILSVHPEAALRGLFAPAGALVFGEADKAIELAMMLGANPETRIEIGEPLVRLALIEAATVNFHHDPILPEELIDSDILPAGFVASLLEDATDTLLGDEIGPDELPLQKRPR